MGWIIVSDNGDLSAIKADINKTRPVYGTMAITQRDTGDPSPFTLVVTAHPSSTDRLNPPSSPVTAGPGPFGGYHKVTAFIADGAANEITVASSEMTVPSDGVYVTSAAYASFRHSANNSTVGFVFGFESAGQISFSQRPVSTKQPNLGNITNLSGGGQAATTAGSKLSLWVASDTAGTITIGNANITVHMVEDTTT